MEDVELGSLRYRGTYAKPTDNFSEFQLPQLHKKKRHFFFVFVSLIFEKIIWFNILIFWKIYGKLEPYLEKISPKYFKRSPESKKTYLELNIEKLYQKGFYHIVKLFSFFLLKLSFLLFLMYIIWLIYLEINFNMKPLPKLYFTKQGKEITNVINLIENLKCDSITKKSNQYEIFQEDEFNDGYFESDILIHNELVRKNFSLINIYEFLNLCIENYDCICLNEYGLNRNIILLKNYDELIIDAIVFGHGDEEPSHYKIDGIWQWKDKSIKINYKSQIGSSKSKVLLNIESVCIQVCANPSI